VQVDYQSVGSGGGKKSVIDKTVDFGASDAAMTDEEIGRVQGGVQLLPMTAGAIVIAYNVEGVPALKLSRKAYTGIFLGQIKKWNDPAIASVNPGVKLPDLPVNVGHGVGANCFVEVLTNGAQVLGENETGSGIVRRYPADPASVQLAAPQARLDAIVLYGFKWPRRATRGARAGHHDTAHDHSHQPRRARLGPI
jgi:hypothetical protein